MNREIKFRAWTDQGTKGKFRMEYGVGLMPTENGFGLFLSQGQGSVLMQFTGLHDKNGKEIYEGDIVSFPKQPKYKRTWQVEWQNGGLRLVDGIGYRMLNSDHHGQVNEEGEVIGNIWESPNLLDTKK